jgi:hypothetical protein
MKGRQTNFETIEYFSASRKPAWNVVFSKGKEAGGTAGRSLRFRIGMH